MRLKKAELVGVGEWARLVEILTQSLSVPMTHGLFHAYAQRKAPDDAGAFKVFTLGGDQYFATNGPVQLKR
jgi:hypothetical protein